MLCDHEHDEIVGLFYSAAAGGISWPTALDRTASLFESSASLLGVHDKVFSTVVAMESHNYSADFIGEFFRSEVFINDPRLPCMDRIPDGCIYFDEMLYDVREIERDPWVKASIDQLGVFDQIGVKLRIPGERFVSFGLLRTRKQGRVSREAIEAFKRLTSPLEQACGLGYLLEAEARTRSALIEIFESRSAAVILLDRAGKVEFTNQAARRLLDDDDGLTLRDGMIVARRPPEARKLNQLIDGVLKAVGTQGRVAGGQMLVGRPSRKRPYALSVTAAPRAEAFLSGAGMACIVLVEALASPVRPDCTRLRELFGLTERESDLAAELVATAHLDQAAERCGMALNTARNHLQSIFCKSGTRSQIELVQLFGRLS